MPELLKNIYNQAFFEDFAAVLQKVLADFNKAKFIQTIFDSDWQSRELKQRMRHTATVLHGILPVFYPEALEILLKITEQIRKKRESEMSFEYMFLPDFVEVYGLDDYENSVAALEIITQLTSAEFAVRPFLIKYPEKMMQQMLIWSKHPQAMVRRLASEGTRPSLPWAMAVPALKKNPKVILPILENLKADSSETVRRSVANNLNDISKDYPEIVLQVAEKWSGLGIKTDWVIKHACRTLLKRADSKILLHFGLEPLKDIFIQNLKLSSDEIKIGESFEFSFQLLQNQAKPVKIRLEYAIYFLKASAKHSKKVFKISENSYQGNQAIEFRRKQSFKDLTTRKHHAGEHKLAIIVNGIESATVQFLLKA